mmetsp:Transcript_9966/g.16010  ORF Transcript_9966/g.16010 Transcript_9966/m.16010 type:complete len:206 (-) Transcript_9966:1706-2323(-)
MVISNKIKVIKEKWIENTVNEPSSQFALWRLLFLCLFIRTILRFQQDLVRTHRISACQDILDALCNIKRSNHQRPRLFAGEILAMVSLIDHVRVSKAWHQRAHFDSTLPYIVKQRVAKAEQPKLGRTVNRQRRPINSRRRRPRTDVDDRCIEAAAIFLSRRQDIWQGVGGAVDQSTQVDVECFVHGSEILVDFVGIGECHHSHFE